MRLSFYRFIISIFLNLLIPTNNNPMIINNSLIKPQSIVIIGGSNNVQKPGGRIIKNIVEEGYSGELYIVNPKENKIQNIQCYSSIDDLPDVDLAILAIPSQLCVDAVKKLAEKKQTKAFIIISAGFAEESVEGEKMEKNILGIVNSHNGCLIGPNCIGVITKYYKGVFTSPIPPLSDKGIDIVSGSGATAVFILESALPKGLRIASLFSVGNSTQVGVEEIMEYWDVEYKYGKSAGVKLIYVESIKDPQKFLKHSSSLINKGCQIAAIKSGRSEEGIKAATSHTGAMASSDIAVEAMFRKAGIIRCDSREELVNVASIFMNKILPGNNLAIITHAGGPAVMLTDVLSGNSFNIPVLKETDAKYIKDILYQGASIINPIDIMATGTADQLDKVLDLCTSLDYIDGCIIIFGSPGLQPVFDAYEVIHKHKKNNQKPIFPILPSISMAAKEIKQFHSHGHTNFSDEVLFGKALAKVYNRQLPFQEIQIVEDESKNRINEILRNCDNGFLPPDNISLLLDQVKIPYPEQAIVNSVEDVLKFTKEIGHPVVMKVVGPVHKTDVKGVSLNISTDQQCINEFQRLSGIENCKGVIIQPMLSGLELYIGASYEAGFGHLVFCGLGGIYIEIQKDITVGLTPLSFQETLQMIKSLKSIEILKGYRGMAKVDINRFAEIILKVSELISDISEIKELDINPLIVTDKDIYAVDTRILIER